MGLKLFGEEIVRNGIRPRSIPTCRSCSCTARHIPGLTLNERGWCGECQSEWDELAALGLSGRALSARFNARAEWRLAERKAEVRAARLAGVA